MNRFEQFRRKTFSKYLTKDEAMKRFPEGASVKNSKIQRTGIVLKTYKIISLDGSFRCQSISVRRDDGIITAWNPSHLESLKP